MKHAPPLMKHAPPLMKHAPPLMKHAPGVHITRFVAKKIVIARALMMPRTCRGVFLIKGRMFNQLSHTKTGSQKCKSVQLTGISKFNMLSNDPTAEWLRRHVVKHAVNPSATLIGWPPHWAPHCRGHGVPEGLFDV
jgi:hypothetical protein